MTSRRSQRARGSLSSAFEEPAALSIAADELVAASDLLVEAAGGARGGGDWRSEAFRRGGKI